MSDPYAPVPQAAYYVAPPAPPRALSITSMVLGIVGITMGWFILGLPSIAAVIFGHIGLKREPAGRPFAITGLVTGYVGIAFAIIVTLIVLFSILLPLFILGGIAVTDSNYS